MAKTREIEALREAAQRIVESSCREQGIEVQITDPVVIGKIAAIFRVGSGEKAVSRRNSFEPIDTEES